MLHSDVSGRRISSRRPDHHREEPTARIAHFSLPDGGIISTQPLRQLYSRISYQGPLEPSVLERVRKGPQAPKGPKVRQARRVWREPEAPKGPEVPKVHKAPKGLGWACVRVPSVGGGLFSSSGRRALGRLGVAGVAAGSLSPQLFRHVHRPRRRRGKPQDGAQSVVRGRGNAHVSVQAVSARNRVDVAVPAQLPQQKHGVAGRPSHPCDPTVAEKGTGSQPSKVDRNQLVLSPAVGSGGVGAGSTTGGHGSTIRASGCQVTAMAWSEAYKRRINCARPKGFSQRAHCAGNGQVGGRTKSDVQPSNPDRSTDPSGQTQGLSAPVEAGLGRGQRQGKSVE